MRKAVLVTILFSFSLFAQDLKTFEKEALARAFDLKIEALRQQMQTIETTLPLYDRQMELELFGAQYKESTYRSGGSVGIKIPILLNTKELRAIASTQRDRGKLLVRYAKAKYLRDLELLFTDYVYATNKVQVASQNAALAKKIERAVYKLFSMRAATKKDLLRAQSLVLDATKEALQARREREQARMALERFAQTKVNTKATFLYANFDENKGIASLPLRIQALAARQAMYQRKNAAKKIRRIDFVLEYEKEPDQDIYRVGVAIPLVDSGMVRQQERLALMKERAVKLQMQKSRYELAMRLQALKQEAKLLQKELMETRKLVAKEQEALDVSLRAFGLRAASMTQIVQARRSLLQAEQALLKTQYEFQKRIIQIRFFQGAYDG